MPLELAGVLTIIALLAIVVIVVTDPRGPGRPSTRTRCSTLNTHGPARARTPVDAP